MEILVDYACIEELAELIEDMRDRIDVLDYNNLIECLEDMVEE